MDWNGTRDCRLAATREYIQLTKTVCEMPAGLVRSIRVVPGTLFPYHDRPSFSKRSPVERILVLGATGYVGGRLVPRLLREGYSVRCMARDPRKLYGRQWSGVEVTQGDVLDQESLARAMAGCGIVYYLVHSMGGGEATFVERDRLAARNCVEAAAAAGIRRIIYLGGLGERSDSPSPHLRSRNEVGEILGAGPVPVTEFRAAMIIGSGSASFDMMHALVNRLPIMIAPRWVSTRSQPISIHDVLRYLVEALTVSASAGRVIDIGGTDILTYREMMYRLAGILGLTRRILVVPVLTPRLSSLWINLVTPISASLARALVEGLRSEMVCESDLAQRLFSFKPRGFDHSVVRALDRIRSSAVETTWSNASLASRPEADVTLSDAQLLSDVQVLDVAAPPDIVYHVVSSIGGANGWYYADMLWRLRGFMDKMIGGVGLRRGRRHPVELLPGDALDFWRAESVEPGRSLVLRAEMKVPGRAWLEFSVAPLSETRSRLSQTARFYPRGLAGLAYWYGVYPVHVPIFSGMARAIARRAEALADGQTLPTRR